MTVESISTTHLLTNSSRFWIPIKLLMFSFIPFKLSMKI